MGKDRAVAERLFGLCEECSEEKSLVREPDAPCWTYLSEPAHPKLVHLTLIWHTSSTI